MAKFRFVGEYTHDRDSITMNGVEFVGRKATEVPDDTVERFRNNIEFEEVTGTAAKDPGGLEKTPVRPELEVPHDLTAPPPEPVRAAEADAEIRELRDGAPNAKPDAPVKRKQRKSRK
jgi:hypothetical protein